MNERQLVLSTIVGSNIREIRQSKKVSLRKLALSINMDYSHLSNIERGKVDPAISTLIRIANGLNVPIADLFKEEQ